MKLHPTVSELLREIDAFVEQEGMTRTAFGKLAVGNPSLYGRLRDGRNFTLQTLERARSFMNKKGKRRVA